MIAEYTTEARHFLNVAAGLFAWLAVNVLVAYVMFGRSR
jgi:hypothetical protein